MHCVSRMAEQSAAAASPSSASAAATLLSAAMRRRMARKKLTHDLNFQTWNRLDEMKENLAVRSIKKFRDVFGSSSSKSDTQTLSIPSSEIPVEIDYEGLHIKVSCSMV